MQHRLLYKMEKQFVVMGCLFIARKESSELEMKHLCHTRCGPRQRCLCAKALFGTLKTYARSN